MASVFFDTKCQKLLTFFPFEKYEQMKGDFYV